MYIWVVSLIYNNGIVTAITGVFSELDNAKADVERVYPNVEWTKSGSLIVGMIAGKDGFFSIYSMPLDTQMNL